MKKEEKATAVAELTEKFSRARLAIVTECAGLPVNHVTELRKQLRGAKAEYKVVKNRLIRQALKGTSLDTHDGFKKSLTGMTGVAWSYEDPSAAAKIIQKFRKEHDDNQKLEVKGGIMEAEFLSADRVEKELANLPGKDELRASLLAQLMAPAQSMVRQLLAPAQNLIYALDARLST